MGVGATGRSEVAWDEQVPPTVSGAFVHEDVHPVAFLDLQSWWEGLEAALARSALARDEDAIALGQDGPFARLVVPLRRVAWTWMVQMTSASPRHLSSLHALTGTVAGVPAPAGAGSG